ncbi:hypothetical protein ACQZ6B_05195 [Agrobacterium vitis]
MILLIVVLPNVTAHTSLLERVFRLADRCFVIPAGGSAFEDHLLMEIALTHFTQSLRIMYWEFVDFCRFPTKARCHRYCPSLFLELLRPDESHSIFSAKMHIESAICPKINHFWLLFHAVAAIHRALLPFILQMRIEKAVACRPI